ncbi:hypothetical protein HH308_24200 [Gordonia sp. TBRC 11910]|uniref:Uncharacterized protein n=1 Tax=Gordonia asplenii TaxID=2725283 RepID=A0A848L0I7_9ACTN|nr:hypothetical protein [Gordonia asplenii]NMO04326.1 hypothetical protein [Gordonia asplenii]
MFENVFKAALVGLQTVVTAVALVVGIVVLAGASLVALAPSVGEQVRSLR